MTTAAKKRVYVSECKRCTYIAEDKPVGIQAVKRNLEGKSPISCTMCGGKIGHTWLTEIGGELLSIDEAKKLAKPPVTEKA